MTMEKLGVQSEVLHEDLRNEEARLMREIQACITRPGEKTASERASLESRLSDVRNKITELDFGGK